MCAGLIVRQNQPLEVLAELQHPRHELRRIVCRLLGRTGKVLTPQDNPSSAIRGESIKKLGVRPRGALLPAADSGYHRRNTAAF